jgi:hypothetical protein
MSKEKSPGTVFVNLRGIHANQTVNVQIVPQRKTGSLLAQYSYDQWMIPEVRPSSE